MPETTLKIDLDIEKRNDAIKHLRERINFFDYIGILPKFKINKILLLKKSKYSAKIYVHGKLSSDLMIILFQSMLGDDWKRTAITLRDYKAGLRNFNRLFDSKRYANGNYIFVKQENITKFIISDKLELKSSIELQNE